MPHQSISTLNSGPRKSFDRPKYQGAEAALMLADSEIPVFPCDDDKTPFKKWPGAATSDSTTVLSWWDESPDALVAVPMGTGSGLLAVDASVDKRTGEAVGETTLRQLGLDVAHYP